MIYSIIIMIISLIASLTIDRVIGMKNAIPWDLSIDRKWFKLHTINKPIIMGSRTFESIGNKPLCNRFNIVLSSKLSYDNNENESCVVIDNPDKALSLVSDHYEVMIIGGAEVYNFFMPKSTRLYLTYINTTQICGDSVFPDYELSEWCTIFDQCYETYQYYGYNLNFKILERI